MRTLLRRGTIAALLASLGYAAWRVVSSRTTPGGLTYETQPFPMPPRPVAPRVEATARATPATADPDGPSVEAGADGSCPVTHPIKGKLNSGIYHRPGAFAYDRTHADRCYRDEGAAEDDGLRASKR